MLSRCWKLYINTLFRCVNSASLPRSRFLDVTQLTLPQLRDIQKTGARETTIQLAVLKLQRKKSEIAQLK